MKLFSRLFHKIRRTIFPEWSPSLDLSIKSKRFGNKYGGWNIQAKDIDKESIVYSFGVGEDASFDLAIINEIGTTIYAFDPTPRSLDWVSNNISTRNFKMHPYGLGATDGTVNFSAPENPNHVSQTIIKGEFKNTKTIEVQLYSLKSIMNMLKHTHIDILKMDIEGAEYDVIKKLAAENIRPIQILIEFHHRFRTLTIEDTENAIETLRSLNYKVFWCSSSGNEVALILQP